MSKPKIETKTPGSSEPRRPQPANNAVQPDFAARAGDDDMPEDIDEFRLALAQRIMTFIGFWRDCPRPICRRTKSCHQGADKCAGAPDEPPMTEEERQAEWDKARLEIRQALRAHFIRLGLNPDDPELPLDPNQSRGGRRGR